jgi:hypothetical protein
MDVMNAVKDCGNLLRVIYRVNTLCKAGCFIGTKEELIEAIHKKYDYIKDREAYIAKVEELYSSSQEIKNPLAQDYAVQLLLATQGLYTSELCKSNFGIVRAEIAKQGYCAEELHLDKAYKVRLAVAHTGKYGDVLHKDEDPLVRAAVAESGNYHDVLHKDRIWIVRVAVADAGGYHDVLHKDTCCFVREAVAASGGYLDVLRKDHIESVCIIAKNKLKELNNE